MAPPSDCSTLCPEASTLARASAKAMPDIGGNWSSSLWIASSCSLMVGFCRGHATRVGTLAATGSFRWGVPGSCLQSIDFGLPAWEPDRAVGQNSASCRVFRVFGPVKPLSNGFLTPRFKSLVQIFCVVLLGGAYAVVFTPKRREWLVEQAGFLNVTEQTSF